MAREVDELLKRAQEVDEEEDRRYGRDRRGEELPEELSFRESRLRKIREAKAALEAEAAAAEQAEGKGRNPSGVPADKAQREFHRSRVPHHAGPGRPGLHPGLQLPGGGGQRSSGDRGGLAPPTGPRIRVRPWE